MSDCNLTEGDAAFDQGYQEGYRDAQKEFEAERQAHAKEILDLQAELEVFKKDSVSLSDLAKLREPSMN